MPVAGAVLCGGASRRMGRDKATLLINGTAMASRVAAALAAAGCAPVVAIGGDVDGLRAIGIEVQPDRYPGEGPVGGIVTALAWSPAERVVIAACDLPWLTADVVVAVIGAAGPKVAVAHTGERQPLCACWPASALASVEALYAVGERAVKRVLDGLDVVEVPVEAAALRNVNSPADLPRSG